MSEIEEKHPLVKMKDYVDAITDDWRMLERAMRTNFEETPDGKLRIKRPPPFSVGKIEK